LDAGGRYNHKKQCISACYQLFAAIINGMAPQGMAGREEKKKVWRQNRGATLLLLHV
jgi:hypothetical protein